jgi:hypothetical protein
LSPSRKDIRDWFKDAMESAYPTIGSAYTSRWAIIDDNEKKFVSVYLVSGEPDDGLAGTYTSALVIQINQKAGDDDSMDIAADAIFAALESYNETNPSPFDFGRNGYYYGGTSEQPTRSLTLNLIIKH